MDDWKKYQVMFCWLVWVWESFCHSATTAYCCVCSPLSHLSVPFSTIICHHNQHTSLCLLSKLLTVACPVGSIQTWISPFFITFFSSNFEPMQVVIVFPVAMPLVHRLGKPSDRFNLTLTTARSVPNPCGDVHRYHISTLTTSGSGRSTVYI